MCACVLSIKTMEDIHFLIVFMFYNKKILLLKLEELFISKGRKAAAKKLKNGLKEECRSIYYS